MSYDIELTDPVTGEVLQTSHEHFIRGGTYAMGGTTKLALNVTYNYVDHFVRVLGVKGIRTIYGLTGAESLPILKTAMDKLKNDVSDNYWDATEGNTKRALAQLRSLAHLRPDGVWTGD